MTRTFIGVAIRSYNHQSSQKRHIDDDGPGRKVKKECFFQETYGKLRDKTTTTAFVLVDSDK
ncbi:hypothetical protein Bca4012_000677 [Brassica carinata]